LLPENTRFVGYARSKITINDIRDKCKPWFKVITDHAVLFSYKSIICVI